MLIIKTMGVILVILSIGLLVTTVLGVSKSVKFLTRKEIRLAPWLGFLSGAFLIAGLAISSMPSVVMTPKTICDNYAISYELVETVAEYTNYNEYEVANFFVIVADDVEAWEAIKLLDKSLTDAQVEAIMEISSMKQAN